MDNPEDTNNVYADSSIAHGDPSTDRYIFKQIYNITQGDKTHV